MHTTLNYKIKLLNDCIVTQLSDGNMTIAALYDVGALHK